MRHLVRVLVLIVVGVIASLIGVLAALTETPPGRTLLARNVSHQLETLLRGQVYVGNIDGSFLRDLVLSDVVVRDTAGVLLVSLPAVRVRYLIPSFLARRFVLEGLEVDNPIINLVRHPSGRWNYEEVLRLSEGPPGKSVPPLIEFRNMFVSHGVVILAYPWPTGPMTDAERAQEIREVRAIPGRIVEDTREGTKRVLTFSNVTAGIKRLRIQTPQHDPVLVVVDTLNTDASEPALQVRQLRGTIQQQGDSLHFALTQAALPGTIAVAEGLVSWPHDTILWDFRAEASAVDLVDLRFISPEFPAMKGHAVVVAHSLSGRRTEYAINDLLLTDGPERIEGHLVAAVDAVDGLAVRGLVLKVAQLNLDKVRPYIDSLPFNGRVTGDLQADGDLNDIAVRGDITFADLAVPGLPSTSMRFAGRIKTGTDLVFDSLRVAESDIDLRTVRHLAPAVILDGRLEAVGMLDGSLHDATFTGTAHHRDGDRPVSTVDGVLRLDTRADSVRVVADLTLAPLNFDGIRGSFPSILAEGELRGRVKLSGPVERLFVDADVEGDLGAVSGSGTVSVQPPHWGFDTLSLDFRDVDLQALAGMGGRTSLAGHLDVTGTLDSLVAPEGELSLVLGPGNAQGVNIDTLRLHATARDSVLTFDSLFAQGSGLTLAGGGTIGWARPHRGEMTLTLEADSLAELDSLALDLTGMTRDTLPGWRTLTGVLRARVALSGSLDSLEASGAGTLKGLALGHIRANQLGASGTWTGGHRPLVNFSITLDSASQQDRFLSDVRLTLSGPADSINWGLSGKDGSLVSLASAGRAWQDSAGRAIAFDSLRLNLPTRAWRLSSPGEVRLADSAVTLTPLRLSSEDGGGYLSASGAVPWTRAGNMTVEAMGLSVRDLYALVQLDTSGTGGWLGLHLELAGTRADPSMNGTLVLENLHLGDSRGPMMQSVFTYADQRLDGGLLLYRTGDPVMQVRYSLPLDLSLQSVKQRTIPGPISIQATADSVDLSLLEPLTRSVHHVTGLLSADVRVEGTWDAPALGGFVAMQDGALTIDGLNVPFTGTTGRAEFKGDSVFLPTLTLKSPKDGTMTLSGTARLNGLTRPILNLTAELSQFRAIDQKDFLQLTASGRVKIQGPVDSLVLSGRVTADQGVLYFADLLSKRIINLEDPENAAFIDTTLVRRRNLGSDLTARVMQSLRVHEFSLTIGDDFWLRSSEANIQLDGRLRVEKLASDYKLDGTLHAVRGTYRLSPIPGFSRDFEVIKGDVRYFGTPDLNAQLDIEARHTVRTSKGQELPVIALITGTLFDPKLKLESTQRPPLPELDVVSYLVTGAPASEATAAGGAQAALVSNAMAYVLSASASVLEQTIGSELGLAMLQIRPVVSGGSQGQSLSTAFALNAGWQVGRKVFLTFNAGFCPSQFSTFDYKNFGAGLEWRVSQEWKIQGVLEPLLRLCGVTAVGQNVSSSLRYQIGVDVLWQKEF